MVAGGGSTCTSTSGLALIVRLALLCPLLLALLLAFLLAFLVALLLALIFALLLAILLAPLHSLIAFDLVCSCDYGCSSSRCSSRMFS